MCIANTAEAGVGIPIGMFASRDDRIHFRRQVQKIFIEHFSGQVRAAQGSDDLAVGVSREAMAVRTIDVEDFHLE